MSANFSGVEVMFYRASCPTNKQLKGVGKISAFLLKTLMSLIPLGGAETFCGNFLASTVVVKTCSAKRANPALTHC